ncbi:hypothetical protein FAIPA1_100066 [Frankia sp. AiPs1]|uniref:pyridoxal-phosphate dependent enzyme n=1 Tax=Frankia sp. AiPa1 TaxID=573492 RepID=UPI00202AD007|nr:pyridoxal-phosphate dependent enzyme [Frankia sp. AiPa1]MCL9762630.1 pyridoxal-phosphate dependent enzyme [Frankia sp. AiPa1]
MRTAHGSRLTVTGASYAEALAASQRWAASTGGLEIAAFDQVETILGAAGLAVELDGQFGDGQPGSGQLAGPHGDDERSGDRGSGGGFTVLAAVGGGGLLAGIAAWFAARAEVHVVGVEPHSAPTLSRALAAGRPVDAPVGGVAVDSLAPRRVGEHTFAVLHRHLHGVVLVGDDDIRHAQRILWERLRLVAEPGGSP